jgi:hypothetical protein
MNKYLAEFIGTFWLVFGGCGSAIFPEHRLSWLALLWFNRFKPLHLDISRSLTLQSVSAYGLRFDTLPMWFKPLGVIPDFQGQGFVPLHQWLCRTVTISALMIEIVLTAMRINVRLFLIGLALDLITNLG